MQLNLAFVDQPDPPSSPAAQPGTWDRLDEASRVTALEILARLIARMLTARPAMEASDE